ncbi:hypothetical protein PR048_007558 [Dryococelus australis]|uniref:Uncharacterized protein n=1 Tax=Dryococelus australis TaxID=614101 RepID=A0ABQ9HUN6_9NEOP|nr:hypothetical protein PR048_007558 [Dryococelus australis]
MVVGTWKESLPAATGDWRQERDRESLPATTGDSSHKGTRCSDHTTTLASSGARRPTTKLTMSGTQLPGLHYNSVPVLSTIMADEHNYCSLTEVLKLIDEPFNADKSKLKEIIDNVEAAIELTNPLNHYQLLKFVKGKIHGEAKTKLLARTAIDSWE